MPPSRVNRAEPSLGAISPWQSFRNSVLPAPFGPTTTVRRPLRMFASSIATSVQPSRRNLRPWIVNGRIEVILCTRSPREPRAQPGYPIGRGVDDQREADQDSTEAERQRQIPFRGFQRDGRGHGAGEAVDIAPDDENRADLRACSSEAGQKRGDERKSSIPQQGRNGAQASGADGAEVFGIFAPEVLDSLARERDDDRQHKNKLGNHHRARRKQQTETTQRPGS